MRALIKFQFLILPLIIILIGCQTTSSGLPATFASVPKQSNTLLKHLKTLSADELGGRKVGSDGNILAQNYLVSSLKANNIQPLDSKFRHYFELKLMFQSKSGTNIIGIVEGTEFPDKYIILSAHFDHIGKKGRHIYNGADDNASGTATLLTFAERIAKSPLRHSVILLFTDGEESNLSGATSFVESNSSLISNVKLNINLDMLAGDKNTKVLRYISSGIEALLPKESLEKFVDLQDKENVSIKKGFKQTERGYGLNRKTKWQTASDHGAFYRLKIPFIYYGVGEHSNYHQPTDTYDNVNLVFFAKATDAIYRNLLYIDKHM